MTDATTTTADASPHADPSKVIADQPAAEAKADPATAPKKRAKGKSAKSAKKAERKAKVKAAAATNPKPEPKEVAGDKADPKKSAGKKPPKGKPAPQLKDKRPAPKLESHPLDALTFDPSNQNRESMYDDATVRRYVEALLRGAKFPPLVAVREKPGGPLLVIAGFNRGEAIRRWNAVTDPKAVISPPAEFCGEGHKPFIAVEVLVYKGTPEDARYWALSENDDHGLARTSGDERKALGRLLNDPDMLGRAAAHVAPGLPLDRVLAGVCKVSKGLVAKVLAERGQMIRGAKIVSRPADAPPPAVGKGDRGAAAPPAAPSSAGTGKGDAGTPAAPPVPHKDEHLVPDSTRRGIAAAAGMTSGGAAAARRVANAVNDLANSDAGRWFVYLFGPKGTKDLRQVTKTTQAGGRLVWEWTGTLARLVAAMSSAKPVDWCKPCKGGGCKHCRDTGMIPNNRAYLPKTGKPGDLFKIARDIEKDPVFANGGEEA